MPTLVARTAHTVFKSCSRAVPEVWRSVQGSLACLMLQYRSYSDEGLDGRVPSSPEALSAGLSGEFPPAVPEIQTFGADKPVCDRNAYPPRKWGRFRVRVPVAILKPQLTRTVLNEEESRVGNCHRAFSNVFSVAKSDRLVLPVEVAIYTSEAITILKHRQQQGIRIDSYTFVEVLKRCLDQKDLIAARQVHDCIIQSGMEKNQDVVNTLLNLYVRWGRLQDARRVFDEVQKKDDFTWTTMIGGYAKTNQVEDAPEVFNQVRQGCGKPREPLCMSILKACASPSALKWGKEVNEYTRHAGLVSDVRVGTALVQMYASVGASQRQSEYLKN